MRIRPNLNLKSIYNISIAMLRGLEIEAVFFDLDSTVMPSKSGKFPPETIEFLEKLQKYFKIAVISNNNNPVYIQKAKSQVNFPVVGYAKKPDTKILLGTCEKLGVKPENCAFVGDRPLTDILCARRAKMFSILVDSITADVEAPIVRFVRRLERLSIKK